MTKMESSQSGSGSEATPQVPEERRRVWGLGLRVQGLDFRV